MPGHNAGTNQDLKMIVAFVTNYPLNDGKLRSGVPFFISEAFKSNNAHVIEVLVQDKRNLLHRVWSRLWQWYATFIHKSLYDSFYSVATSKSYATQVHQQLDHIKPDFILSIHPNLIAHVKTKIPLILWLDNSFDTFSLYPDVNNYVVKTKEEALFNEYSGLAKSETVYVASSYLRIFLQKKYPDIQSKFKVLPRGANLINRPEREFIVKLVKHKINSSVLKLVYVNSGWWKRKGGNMVLAIYKELSKHLPVELNIIGKVDEVQSALFNADPNIVLHGKIDKSQIAGELQYQKIIYEMHYSLAPSIAEGFGIVNAEMAALGVPSVGFGIMGVTESIKQNVTGWHLPESANAKNFAELILEKWQDKLLYESTCLSAYDYALEHFDWQKNVAEIITGIKEN